MFETPSLDLAPAPQHGVGRLWLSLRGPAISAAVIVAVVAVWEVGVRLFHVPDFILPAPSAILRDTVAWDGG